MAEHDRAAVAELARTLNELKNTTAELKRRKKQLLQLNRWFQVALNNMGRGLSMFDARQCLIVCNRQYREIYDLPARLTAPGTPFATILSYHDKSASTGRAQKAEHQAAWIGEHLKELRKGKTFSYTQHLRNGRIVQVTNQPLKGGGWVDIQEDITDRRKAEHRINWLANHDPLTQAANRTYFTKQLEHALHQLRPGVGIAVHFIDLDHFKAVNDELGHPVGDALLKVVVKRIGKVLRGHDLLARLGGASSPSFK